MWTDCEDLVVLSDMYQLKIKIITTKGNGDKNPTVNRIFPDEDMKEFAELKDVAMDELVLFHENDNHYNLVVDKDSDLAVLGSLSYRFNIGPVQKDKNDVENVYEEKGNTKDISKQLKECRESKKRIENQYLKCEEELRNKTEEVEVLKVELKDLREILELKDTLGVNGLEESLKDAENTEDNVKSGSSSPKRSKGFQEKANNLKVIREEFKCKECTMKCSSKAFLDKHMEYAHIVLQKEQFNCSSCDFQATSKIELNKHFNLKHKVNGPFNCSSCVFHATSKIELNTHFNLKHRENGQRGKQVIHCKTCNEQFSDKWNLMYHRKSQHINTVAMCRNHLEGKCQYTAEMCWWKHETSGNMMNEGVSCFICNETFESKTSMMKHRKDVHKSVVRRCEQFLKNNCRFHSKFCWFLHEEEDMETEESTTGGNDDKEEQESVFQRVLEDIDPPINKLQKQKLD